MSSSVVISQERLSLSGVKTLHRSDTSDAMSQADSQSLTGKILFLTTFDAMEFAETGYLREVCLDLSVSILRVLHAKKLECEKLTELMHPFHCSRLHWSGWNSSAVAALPEFSPLGASRKVQ